MPEKETVNISRPPAGNRNVNNRKSVQERAKSALQWLANHPVITLTGWFATVVGLALSVYSCNDAIRGAEKNDEDYMKMSSKLNTILIRFRALNVHDQVASAPLLDGYLHWEAECNNWPAVLHLSELMLAIDERSQSALNFRGQYERQYQHDCEKAKEWYNQSLAVNPNNKYAADAHFFIGNCYWKEKDRSQALFHFLAAQKIEPRYPGLSEQIRRLDSGPKP